MQEVSTSKHKLVYIYTLEHPITGEIRYVGKTVNLKSRMYNHISIRKEREYTKNISWVKSLLEQGLRPVMKELESFPIENVAAWEEGERFWISSLRFLGCNLNNHESGGNSGKTHDRSTKAKIGGYVSFTNPQTFSVFSMVL